MLSPTHRVSGCRGFQTPTSSLRALRCTGPLSAGRSEALSRDLFSHQHAPLFPRHRPDSFRLRPLCSQRLEPQQGVGNAEAATLIPSSPKSGCCSLLLLLLKNSAGDDPSDFPVSKLAASPVRPLSKVTQQVWSGMSASLPLPCSVLVVLPSCVELFGSTLSQGVSRTSPYGFLPLLFAASAAL